MRIDSLFEIKINNPKPVDVCLQLVTFSVPLPFGKLFSTENIGLYDETEQFVEGEFVVVARWPDTSIKLLHVNALVSLCANSSQLYSVKQEANTPKPSSQQQTTSQLHYYDIPSPAFKLLTDSQKQNSSDIAIVLKQQAKQLFDPSQVTAHPQITETATIVERTKAGFDFQSSNLPLPVQLFYRTEFISRTGQLNLSVTLRNPNSAIHPNGTWDLGDPKSFYFSELSVVFNHQLPSVALKVENDKIVDTSKHTSTIVMQQGSGGKNWQSPVHLDKDDQIDVDGAGYIVTQSVSATSSAAETTLSGERSAPVVVLGEEQQTTAIYIDKFWQNFPSAISIEKQKVTLGLFPARNGKYYELQPGEQKTYQIVIQNFNDCSQAFHADTPLEVTYPQNVFADRMLLPLLKHDQQEAELANLIAKGLQDKNNFFAKREKIDEFGWRNFGEIFADHETEGYTGEDIFVSHYNNQYDPIYGFLRQYLATGDPKWFELADDLARHVIDIDIYHTELDKADYNGGLFWHTDHYCPANTATHRTFSTKQNQHVYDGHAGGGGPGGQHCYTTGLMLHYWLTGYEPSKDTVLTLTNWITNLFEGTDTLFETLLSIKNSHRNDIKNILTGQYPLDRGTGNYIIALLDSYQLTSAQSYLDRAGKILKSTISAFDDIPQRQLDDVERNWFYTVLLQAASRYLLIKQAAGQFDKSFCQIQAALLHYAAYMADHESPYLDKPEILEFPNQTWTAQDLRKSNIFNAAAYFCADQQQKQTFLTKGEHFYQYVSNTLGKAPSAAQTRILVLLMQNSGYASWFKERGNPPKCLSTNTAAPAHPRQKPVKLLLIKILSLNIKNELTWLRKRSAKVEQILNKLGLQ